MSAIAGGVGIGAGVGVSSVALAPFNAANTFMGSAFFGYGMILGERYMYQSDWPKIQARLENGEKIENIIQEYTGTFTAVVMKEARIIFDTVTKEFIEIMRQALLGQGLPPTTTAGDEHNCPPGTVWDGTRCRPTTVESEFKSPTETSMLTNARSAGLNTKIALLPVPQVLSPDSTMVSSIYSTVLKQMVNTVNSNYHTYTQMLSFNYQSDHWYYKQSLKNYMEPLQRLSNFLKQYEGKYKFQ